MLASLPDHVTDWLKDVFGTSNAETSALLSRVPNVHEPALDMVLISGLKKYETPSKLAAGWVVRIDTHFLGGASRLVGRWEIADIGVLVMFRRGGRLVSIKVGLLQSKRLYPNEQELDEDRELDYVIGFGRLHESDAWWASIVEERRFSFDDGSQYKALEIGNDQYNRIADYERRHSIPVYYLFYNPWSVPQTSEVPASGNGWPAGEPDVGARVVPAVDLRTAMTAQRVGHRPSYSELGRLLEFPFDSDQNQAGWRLEDFIVDLLLGCSAGYRASGSPDVGLEAVFYRRSGPISAAIAITVDAPD